MSTERAEQNVLRATELHRQLALAGLKHGCFEVSLTALGAAFTPNDIAPQLQEYSFIDSVEQAGFKVNWQVGTDQEVEAADITALLEGKIQLEEEYKGGEVVGYLWSEHYPNGRAHMMAILPDEPDSYLVIDTANPTGTAHLKAPDIAFHCNAVVSKGGSFEIFQIKQENNAANRT